MLKGEATSSYIVVVAAAADPLVCQSCRRILPGYKKWGTWDTQTGERRKQIQSKTWRKDTEGHQQTTEGQEGHQKHYKRTPQNTDIWKTS